MKKILAMILAALLVLAMGVGAMAADTIDETTVGAAGNILTFNDVFTVSVSDGGNAVNLPAATFNYTIAPGNGVDATNTTPAIKAGVISEGKPSITNAVHPATVENTENAKSDTQDVIVDFTGVSFDEPGIYRYVITVKQAENATADDITLDINGAGTKGTVYLDVYVQRNNEDVLGIASYVLMKDVETPAYDGEGDEKKIKYNNKIDTITHDYKTYTLTITKNVVGNMAVSDYLFTVDLSVPGGAKAKHVNGNYVTGDLENNENKSDTISLGKTQPSVTIEALPSAALYKIKEAVNLTEGYTVVVDDSNTQATYAADGTTAFGATGFASVGAENRTITFTNTLNAISPTGVVLRFAPYIIMAGIAVVLLVLASRRRKDTQDKSGSI